MIAALFGSSHVLLIVVAIVLVLRVGYGVMRSQGRRNAAPRNDDERPPRAPQVTSEAADTLRAAAPATTVSPEHPENPSSPHANGSALEVTDLHVSYGPTRAVDGLSLAIAEGEIFGLLGPNGAGKTTTLSAIEGLLEPDSGTILIGGLDNRIDRLAAKARIGVQFQATGFQSALAIREIVKLYAGLYGLALSKSEVLESLASVGLDDEAAKRFAQLSGGQQQRLSLLIATIHNPPLVLLDEPTAGLDPQARRQLWHRIERSRQSGRSILLTTHSMEEAQAVCDRAAIMDHGRVLTSDTPAGLIEKHKDDPRVRSVAHGQVTLDDVFIGLTGEELRD